MGTQINQMETEQGILLSRLTSCLTFLAILVLGLSAGASLAEATLLVPFWKTMSGMEFFAWYQGNKETLVAFYSPLQIWSAVLAVLAAASHWISRRSPLWSALLSALFALGVLATFFLFFKDANAGLAAGPMSDNDLQASLLTWEIWQWIRIGLATLAFGFAVISALWSGAQIRA
ncbi:MAG: hypothetical protein KDK23_08465 [Leptospiraceae bacterium]|nr:hypothetical protein [Leptospiraceae bacterium]